MTWVIFDGLSPTSEEGEGFACSTHDWYRLGRFCCDVSATARAAKRPGMNAGDSLILASTLREEVRAGRAADFAMAEALAIPPSQLSEEECWCLAYFKKSGSVPCTICDGTGLMNPIDEAAYWTLSLIESYADFLTDSGGCVLRVATDEAL